MSKILWIMNKYVTVERNHAYYPYFLKYLQEKLGQKELELHFVFFSDLMKNFILGKKNHFYDARAYNSLNKDEIQIEARRIEQYYKFTLKQAWFPDILQTFKHQNGRKIIVPKNELNDLEPLVKKFLYLEELVKSEQIDVIFSDVSPEVEMEFGRAIGLKYGIPVLKSYEGSFLGRTVLMKHKNFGKDQLIETEINQDCSIDEAEKFLDDYIKNESQPSYVGVKKLMVKKSIAETAKAKLKNEQFRIILYPFKFVYRLIFNLWLWFESSVLKQTLYDRFELDKPYLFFGFHLNQESTMGLRSLPYVNQISLIEILSRVLPFGYTLYVREHPHWPKMFPYSYLKKCKIFPNVKLLSPRISIHDILKYSKGILVYNANTGIEALMHGKPVLSFASNIYYQHHPAVLYCTDLYELGEKLSQLINTKVNRKNTIDYLQKMHRLSIDFSLGSNYFLSEEDAKEKAIQFSRLMIKGINCS